MPKPHILSPMNQVPEFDSYGAPILHHWAFCFPWEVRPWYSWAWRNCSTSLDAKYNPLYVGSYLKHGHYTRIFGVEHVTWPK